MRVVEQRLQGLDGEISAIGPHRAAETLVDRLRRPVVGLAGEATAEQPGVVEALVAGCRQPPFAAERIGQGGDHVEHKALTGGHAVVAAAGGAADAEVVAVGRVVVQQMAERPAQLDGSLVAVPVHAEGLGAIRPPVEDAGEGGLTGGGVAQPLAGGVAENLQVGQLGAALHAADRQVEIAVEIEVAPAGHGPLQTGKGDGEALETAAAAHQGIAQQLGGEQAALGVEAGEQQVEIAVVVDIGPGG